MPTYSSSADASSNPARIVWVLFVHLVLSLHNGWIDPVLTTYRQMYRHEENQARREREMAAAAERERERKEEEDRRQQQAETVAEEVKQETRAQNKLDDLLFG